MTAMDLGIMSRLGLPRIYQLGLVVKDIDAAVSFYTKFMGIRPWYRGEVAEQETIIDGKSVDMEVDMVFGYSGKLMIELVEVKSGGDNIYSQHLNMQGEGLHHLGIEVRNFDAQMKLVAELGIKVLQSGTVKSKGGAISKMAYIDTRDWCGYPIELMESRIKGIPVGKSQFMMKVGCLLGDVTKVQAG